MSRSVGRSSSLPHLKHPPFPVQFAQFLGAIEAPYLLGLPVLTVDNDPTRHGQGLTASVAAFIRRVDCVRCGPALKK